MTTVTVDKEDLKSLLGYFHGFVEEDSQSCDYCRFCGMRYGNAARMEEHGEKLTHYKDCEHLIAQDMGTGL